MFVKHGPYINDSLSVSEQQVSKEPGLGHVSQFDHVVHTLHRRRVHDPEGGFLLLRQTVLLGKKETRKILFLFFYLRREKQTLNFH